MTEINGRDRGGKFTAGNKFSNGNPMAKQAHALRKALYEAVTPADIQAAINWLRSKPWVSAPIVGANRPEQLRQTITGLDQRLSTESLARLDEVSSFRRSRSSLET